jgi:GTPase
MPPSLKRSPLPSIALVGRANVGKSTLWNKITERPRALVSPLPHTTRDRNIASATWRAKQFELVDTGGMDVEKGEVGQGIRRQAERAIAECDLVLFVVDGKTGVVPDDRALAKSVRKLNPHIVLVVNKVDHPRDMASASEGGVYGLGLGTPVAISAATGKGVGDLLDALYERLESMGRPALDWKEEPAKERKADRAERRAREVAGIFSAADAQTDGAPQDHDHPLRLVLMGRPNVGKSSIVNSILGEERVIVSPVAHTTREPQDTPFTYNDRDMVLVDTAGMRKRSNVTRGLEEEGLERNKEALREADIALLVFDATEDPRRQDRALAGLMESEDKGLILVANKWDLVEHKTTSSTKEYEVGLRQLFPFLHWAPIVFVSAKENLRTKQLLDRALTVQQERNRTIDYNALNRFLKGILKQKRPLASYGPKSPYIHDLAQVGTEPPRFLLTIRGEKETVHPSWLKFVEKRLRDKFGFDGTPIVVTSTNIPMAKSERTRNTRGPGMEAVAGRITEKWMVQKKKNVRRRPSGGR